jgi:tRNA modification GTPase
MDTIAAIATPPGIGGIGIIRVSGDDTSAIARRILNLKHPPKPRYAIYSPFFDEDQSILDQGIALYFPRPHSFTGESVLELQGHGGSVVLDCVLRRVIQLGARMAKPGEFLERAFLNNKYDLSQAEAIYDLINASSQQAARAALNSLQGVFSNEIDKLCTKIIEIRTWIEAAIDFSDQSIDFLTEQSVMVKINELINELIKLERNANRGLLMREGFKIVLLGVPNVGKSSLLNFLSGDSLAIVTPIPGTTRDLIRSKICIDGLFIELIDTAGLHQSADPVEQEGMRRALGEIEQAHRVFWIMDSTNPQLPESILSPELLARLKEENRFTFIFNKIDQTGESAMISDDPYDTIKISIKTKEGIDLLFQYLKNCIEHTPDASQFSARRRHLQALTSARFALESGLKYFKQSSLDILAEELAQAHRYLGEIVGKFTTEDLLDEIFSSFCIGK